MANLLSTWVSGSLTSTGRIIATYNTDRYQFNLSRASGSNWWFTNDNDKLGLHINNVGDKFYFGTGGDFWSESNGWLSTALSGKSNTGHTHDDRYLVKGGSWYGSGLPGSRWGGFSVSGGEIVFGDGLPNAGQMGVLIDGAYLAGENNGFWSLASDNSWGSRRGMYWDGSNLNFIANNPTALFNSIRLSTSTNNGTISGGGDWGIRFANDNGWIQFGPANNSWTHIYSDKNFYFNQELYVNNVQVVKNTGTWGINITGSANSASTAGSAGVATTARRISDPDRIGFNVGGNASTFYPIAIFTGAGATDKQYSEFIIERGGYEDPGYSGIGFSTFNARFTYKPSGWGYQATYFNLEQLSQTTTMLGDYIDQYQSSQAIIWLRGATRYNIYSVYGSIDLLFANESGTSYTMSYGTYDPIDAPKEKATTAKYYEGSVRYSGTIYTGSNTVIHSGNIASQSVTYATTAGGVAWSNISSKPTTISGYGITDAITTGNIGSQSVSYATTSGTFSTGRTNYKGTTDNAVAGQLMWKNYGNNHTIFDASNSTSPDGTVVNNTNSAVAWSGSYPTLMGWNGSSTYGVRVDSARVSDSTGNANTLEGFSAYGLVAESRGVHSGSDFPNGTLVTTDINANGWAGDSFIMEVSGKSYGSGTPFKLIMEGYLYADTIINVSAMSYGSYFPAPVKVMRYNGNVAFWWPRGSYWNSFEVHVRSANGDSWNRVTGITDSVDPASADKKISITPTQVIHTGNIASQSVSYATTSGTSAATAQTNFASLTVGGLDVATREYVTSQGYLQSLPSHTHDDRYYTETEINSITHQWEWRWIRRAGYLAPASGSATDWTNYYLSYFTERTNATEGSYPEQASGYINTITNVDGNGGFGGSTYGNIFGDLDSYHCLIYTNIFVEKEFRVTVSNFNGDDPHAIFIDGVFVHGNTGCCVDTSYIYTFKPGWHRIDLIYSEGGGGDFIRMGWNPKDYTGNIKDMTPHRAGENPRNILDKIKNLVIQSDQSVRAPIFYDSNDTSYYLDPNGSSVLNGTVIIKGNDNQLAIDGTTGALASGLFFRESGNNKYELYHYNGEFRFYNYTTNQQELSINNSGGFVTARTSLRAPIFYDSQDTNYYIDPNSYSQTSSIYANNWFRAQVNTGLYFSSYARGIWSSDSAGASYGNVSIYGDGINSWPGYAINNLAMFMARDIRRGIFIPSADAWLIRYEQSSNMAFVDLELQWGSDIRYKSNIKRLTGALDTVKQLKGVTYNYKGNERTSIGFIAQEVEPVLPEVVSTDADGFKSIGYANIVALLSEAIKEQQVMIEQLKARIDVLESK
jgi:hypothetical protein